MAKTTKKLSDVHRAFLVREFACFATPMEAADALSKEFSIEITPQSAQHYDATSFAGSRAAKKWQELFGVCRTAFLDDVEKRVPEAYKAVRIQELAKAARIFKQRGNYLAQANLLEKIARELGGVHSNRHEITGRAGGPIKFEDVSEMTNEMLESEIDRLWAKAQGTEVTTPTKH